VLYKISKTASLDIYLHKDVNKKISLDYKNVSLSKLLKKVTRGYQVVFKYGGNGLKSLKVFDSNGASGGSLKNLEKLTDETTGILAQEKLELASKKVKKPKKRGLMPKIVWERNRLIKKFQMFGALAQVNREQKYENKMAFKSLAQEAQKALGSDAGSTYYSSKPSSTYFNSRNTENNRIRSHRSRMEYQRLNNPGLVREYKNNRRGGVY